MASISQNLRRRDVLRLATSIAGVGLVSRAAGAAPVWESPESWSEFAARLLPHAASACMIGQRYLACSPDAPRVMSDALKRLKRPSVGGFATEAEMIVTALRSDFENDRTVTVDGWVLSETEIALCVLVALRCA